MRRHAAFLVLLLLVVGCGGEEQESGRQATAPPERPEPVLELPYDLAVDSEGGIYVADGLLHQVLRVDPVTGESEVFAGTGEVGSAGDGGPASEATIQEPVGIAFAPDGSLLIADFAANRIRAVAPDGTITTIAGTGRDGRSGDGGAATRADLGSLPTSRSTPPGGTRRSPGTARSARPAREGRRRPRASNPRTGRPTTRTATSTSRTARA